MGIKVSALTSTVVDIQLTDLLYVAEDIGGGSYQSSKLPYQNLLDNLDTDINFPDNIYTGDNSLSGNREVSLGSFNLGFTGTGNLGIGVTGIGATDKLHVVGNSRSTGLKINTASFSHANTVAELAGNTKVSGRLSVGDDGGFTDSAIATGIATFNSNLFDIKLWLQASDNDKITMLAYDKTLTALKSIRLAGTQLFFDGGDIRIGTTGSIPPVVKTVNILGSFSTNLEAHFGTSGGAPTVISLTSERQTILKGLTTIGDSGLAADLKLDVQGFLRSSGKMQAGTQLLVTDETLSSAGESNLLGKTTIGTGLAALDTSLELSGIIDFQNAIGVKSSGAFSTWNNSIIVRVQGVDYEIAAKII